MTPRPPSIDDQEPSYFLHPALAAFKEVAGKSYDIGVALSPIGDYHIGSTTFGVQLSISRILGDRRRLCTNIFENTSQTRILIYPEGEHVVETPRVNNVAIVHSVAKVGMHLFLQYLRLPKEIQSDIYFTTKFQSKVHMGELVNIEEAEKSTVEILRTLNLQIS